MNNIEVVKRRRRSIRGLKVGEKATAVDGKKIMKIPGGAVYLDTGEFVTNLDCLIQPKIVKLCDLKTGQYGLCSGSVLLRTKLGGVNVATGHYAKLDIEVEIIYSFRVN